MPRKTRIKVEIIGQDGIERTRKCIMEEGKIVVRKGSKRDKTVKEYKPSFRKSCLVPYYVGVWIFKSLRHKLVLIDGHDSCVNFAVDKNKNPDLGRFDVSNFFDVNVIKSAGATVQKVTIPTVVYFLLIAIIFFEILGLLVARGIIQIG